MTIDINNLNPSNIADRRVKGGAAEVSDHASAPSDKVSAFMAFLTSADDQVQLSAEAQTLKRLENSVAEIPAFDEARVESIREAIAEGRYHVDADRLAERFMALESELNQ